MSFQNKDFWVSKAPRNPNGSEIAYDKSSSIEPKRSHQWFMDGNEAELLPNKKQAVEDPLPNSYTGLLNSNISSWGNTSGFHSVAGEFTERLFDNETVRITNFDDRNLPAIGMGNMSMGRKVEDPFGIDSTFGLSISQSPVEPRSGISYGGIRKVKVSQVKDAENFISASLQDNYSSGDNGTMLTGHAYRKAADNSMLMGLSFERRNDGMLSMADTFSKDDSNFISMGPPYNKGDTNETSMGLPYSANKGYTLMGLSTSKDASSVTTMSQSFSKEDESNIAMGAFNEDNNSLSMDQVFSRDDSNVTTLGKMYDEGTCNTLSMTNSYGKVDDSGMSMGKTDSSGLSMRNSFSMGENNIISFGGLNDDVSSSERLVCNYDFLMGQPSFHRPEEPSKSCLPESTNDAVVSSFQATAPGDAFSKRKEQKGTKKAPTNNFPSNVRSLLSTGMLDGVPVKYAAWSREKELRGMINGSSYLCGCQSCNFSKAVNAYEFERHAGCKTKHPNNHIYFENGKTIYGVVQELRNTPQSLLFEVIQTITGSPINQKSFKVWKESFIAATRELQRIYGREEGNTVS